MWFFVIFSKISIFVKFDIKNRFSDSFPFQKCILLFTLTVIIRKIQPAIFFHNFWVNTPLKACAHTVENYQLDQYFLVLTCDKTKREKKWSWTGTWEDLGTLLIFNWNTFCDMGNSMCLAEETVASTAWGGGDEAWVRERCKKCCPPPQPGVMMSSHYIS